MIISRNDFKSSIGKENGIDTSRGTADPSTFYARHSSHDSKTGDRITLPFDSGIIMDLIHKRKLLLRI